MCARGQHVDNKTNAFIACVEAIAVSALSIAQLSRASFQHCIGKARRDAQDPTHSSVPFCTHGW